MQSKQRLLTALDRGVPDRLPVTTHHVMPYFLDRYMEGITSDEFFDRFNLDPIVWVVSYMPDPDDGEFIYAIDRDGTIKWKLRTAYGDGIATSPGIGSDGTIYFGSLGKGLCAVNPDGVKK